ncbi:gamma-glutamylaminecyclotransferase [Elysia marginata]|uniref:Gamma-glutamylcyclotransferase family protein n=1 Tax=Elysia marginata TaxID=1093978 RepID=A0AAV4G220_9GAST|nr:gamma-glutamylaminecyclotransferase [Elysia marginata]
MAGASTHFVFLYGTLKTTEPNHHVLFRRDPEGVTFVGEGQTVDLYPLIVTTPFNIPFLLDQEHTGKKILGEIYEINETTLELLDEFEGVPDFYDRKKVKVQLRADAKGQPISDNPKHLDVWLYCLPRFKRSLLDLPHLSNYRGDGVLAPKYNTYQPEIDGRLDMYLKDV